MRLAAADINILGFHPMLLAYCPMESDGISGAIILVCDRILPPDHRHHPSWQLHTDSHPQHQDTKNYR